MLFLRIISPAWCNIISLAHTPLWVSVGVMVTLPVSDGGLFHPQCYCGLKKPSKVLSIGRSFVNNSRIIHVYYDSWEVGKYTLQVW